MITSSDSYNTYDLGKYYVILPTLTQWDLKDYQKTFNAIKVPKGFSYTSGENNDWESVDTLKKYITEMYD
ncbi:hypothetical protein OAK95_00765 [Akkermansiaceae bacterium]|nr:hypothetical protein [Akkermansiaceae bacterium]